MTDGIEVVVVFIGDVGHHIDEGSREQFGFDEDLVKGSLDQWPKPMSIKFELGRSSNKLGTRRA